jgi:uncharacterized membrane protein
MVPAATSTPATKAPSVPPGKVVAIQERHFEVSATFTGPLPPPQILRQYGDLRPDMLGWILKEADEQVAHHRALQVKAVDEQIKDAQARRDQIGIGQAFAFVIALTGILTAAVIALAQRSTAGAVASTVITGTTLVALVTAFITGRKPDRPREQKPSEATKKGTPP